MFLLHKLPNLEIQSGPLDPTVCASAKAEHAYSPLLFAALVAATRRGTISYCCLLHQPVDSDVTHFFTVVNTLVICLLRICSKWPRCEATEIGWMAKNNWNLCQFVGTGMRNSCLLTTCMPWSLFKMYIAQELEFLGSSWTGSCLLWVLLISSSTV